MRPSRLTPALLALTLVVSFAATASAGHRVVLQDGRVLDASTRPVIALGRVNFHDASGRSVSLPASKVNVAATRDSVDRELVGSRVYTASDLAALRGSVRLETARTANAHLAPERFRPTQDEKPVSMNAAAAAHFQGRLDRVRERLAELRKDDPEFAILEQQELALQTEVLRLQTAAELEQLPER